jgi:hypothetical protein
VLRFTDESAKLSTVFVRGVWLTLVVCGCGLSASTRSALKQPHGYTFSQPPPAELIQRAGDKGSGKEGQVTIAINPATGRAGAAQALGLEDPAVSLAKRLDAGLRERGYPDAHRGTFPLGFVRESELPTEAVTALTTPYLLHLQVVVEAVDPEHPTGFEATLLLFDRSGFLQHRSRCYLGRDADGPPVPQDDPWRPFEERCVEVLLKDF